MAKKTAENNQENKQRKALKIIKGEKFKVKIMSKPTEIANRMGCYRMTMDINGVTIYGMTLVEISGKTGKERFIAFPQEKWNDGKYHYKCWADLKDVQDEIIDAIDEILDDDEDEEDE